MHDSDIITIDDIKKNYNRDINKRLNSMLQLKNCMSIVCKKKGSHTYRNGVCLCGKRDPAYAYEISVDDYMQVLANELDKKK